jgi:hypothetical protein
MVINKVLVALHKITRYVTVYQATSVLISKLEEFLIR